jgi:hypothetical protein
VGPSAQIEAEATVRIFGSFTCKHHLPFINMAAPEARRGDFVYRDTLFVDVGHGRHHARASPTELKSLLLPKAGSTPKDQVAHYYEAQLIHYGLPHSREKNTAKVRLTNAINSKSLVVPKEIMQLESELKKEYASLQRKAEIPSKGAKANTNTTTKTSKTTIELEVDGVKLTIDREAIESAKKTTAKATPKPKGAKAATDVPKAATLLEFPAAEKTSATGKSSSNINSSPVRPATSVMEAWPKQTARKSQPSHYPGIPNNHTSWKHSYPLDEELVMDDAPPSYDSHTFSRNHTSTPPNTVQISGTYFVPRPPIRPFQLALQVDSPTQNVWGRFEIGSKSGILFATNSSGSGDLRNTSFRWRSIDLETGAMDFRRDCIGEMHFDGEDWVQGSFKGLIHGEDVEFEAERVNDEGVNLDEARYEWDAIPRRAYGRH